MIAICIKILRCSVNHVVVVVQTSLQLGSVLLRGLGVMSDDVRFLRRMMRESMELRAQETVEKKEHKETDWLVPFQVNSP